MFLLANRPTNITIPTHTVVDSATAIARKTPRRWLCHCQWIDLHVYQTALSVKQIYNEECMPNLDRITRNPEVMGGKPCLRGMRVTVGMIVGLVATGHSDPEILAAYPYLEEEDIRQALAYAGWRVEEIELPLPVA